MTPSTVFNPVRHSLSDIYILYKNPFCPRGMQREELRSFSTCSALQCIAWMQHLQQFNGKKSGCIFTGAENHTIAFFRYTSITVIPRWRPSIHSSLHVKRFADSSVPPLLVSLALHNKRVSSPAARITLPAAGKIMWESSPNLLHSLSQIYSKSAKG